MKTIELSAMKLAFMSRSLGSHNLSCWNPFVESLFMSRVLTTSYHYILSVPIKLWNPKVSHLMYEIVRQGQNVLPYSTTWSRRKGRMQARLRMMSMSRFRKAAIWINDYIMVPFCFIQCIVQFSACLSIFIYMFQFVSCFFRIWCVIIPSQAFNAHIDMHDAAALLNFRGPRSGQLIPSFFFFSWWLMTLFFFSGFLSLLLIFWLLRLLSSFYFFFPKHMQLESSCCGKIWNHVRYCTRWGAS